MLSQQDSIFFLQMPKSQPCEVHLPKYYQETYFSKDSLLHPEVSGEHFGVAGDPVPYVVRNDNLITGLLLLCFVLTIVVLPQFKRFRGLLTFQTCLLFSIVVYFLTKEYVTTTFVIDSDYQLILIFLGMLVVYALLKSGLYTMVNLVFFDGKRNKQFLGDLLLSYAAQGVMLMPAVFLLVYFGLSLQNVLYFFAFVVFSGKIWAFYKSFAIFFRQIGGFLQIILYFCALEIVPLAVLVGIWALLVDMLKINF
jgi:hypothetical protein